MASACCASSSVVSAQLRKKACPSASSAATPRAPSCGTGPANGSWLYLALAIDGAGKLPGVGSLQGGGQQARGCPESRPGAGTAPGPVCRPKSRAHRWSRGTGRHGPWPGTSTPVGQPLASTRPALSCSSGSNAAALALSAPSRWMLAVSWPSSPATTCATSARSRSARAAMPRRTLHGPGRGRRGKRRRVVSNSAAVQRFGADAA